MSTTHTNDPLPVTFSVQVHPNAPCHVLKARHSRGADAVLPPLQFGPDGYFSEQSKRTVASYATDLKRQLWRPTFTPAWSIVEDLRVAVAQATISDGDYKRLDALVSALESALHCPVIHPNDPSLPTAVTYPTRPETQSRQDPQPK